MLRSGNIYNSELNKQKMEFNDWKDSVDSIVFQKLNMHCNDLPDEDYWVYWDKKCTAQDMANIVITNTTDMTTFFLDIIKEDIKYMNS